VKLTADKRAGMPKSEFVGGGPKGAKGFPIPDKAHARLAIGGATRSERAGNISPEKEAQIKAAARAKLGDTLAGK
jgi:hypothetical protein